MKYSCFSSFPFGIGNIYYKPNFINKEAGDYRLESYSSCVDAGTNAFAYGELDIEGNQRIINGVVDMGAYEYIPEPNFLIILVLTLFLITNHVK